MACLDKFKSVERFCDEDYKVDDNTTAWIPSTDWTNAVKVFAYIAQGKELITGIPPSALIAGTTQTYATLKSFGDLKCVGNQQLYLPFGKLTLGAVTLIAARLVGGAWGNGSYTEEYIKGRMESIGIELTSYNPDAEITRDLAIAILVRANLTTITLRSTDNEVVYTPKVLFTDIDDSSYKNEIVMAMRAGLIKNAIRFRPKDEFLRYEIAQTAVLIKHLIEGGSNSILYADKSDAVEIDGINRICSIVDGGRIAASPAIHLEAIASTAIPDGGIAWSTNFGTLRAISASEIEWTPPAIVEEETRVVITAYNDLSVYSYITTVYPTKVVTPLPSDAIYASDYPTLQDAANAAKGKTLAIPAGIYKVRNVVLENVTVLGLGCDANSIIIDGQGLDDVIEIKGNVRVSGVTVMNSRNNGNRSGIVVSGNANLEIVNVVLKNNFVGITKNGSGTIVGHHVTMNANKEAQFRVNGSGEVALTDVKYIGNSTKVDKKGASGSVPITEGLGAVPGICISISETPLENDNNSINFFPNPSKTEITIALNDCTTGAHIQFYEPTGTLVMQTTIDCTNKTVDTSALSPGLYVLVISNGEEKFTKKIVIAR